VHLTKINIAGESLILDLELLEIIGEELKNEFK